MFFGKIKEFKTFNLALLKNLGRAFTSLKTEKNQTCFRDITGRPTCSFVSPNFVQSWTKHLSKIVLNTFPLLAPFSLPHK